MTSNGTSPKRWRPRFSLRTLFVVVTLVCCYFGAWEATNRYGVPAVAQFAETGSASNRFWYGVPSRDISPLPFYVRVSQLKLELDSDNLPIGVGECTREYLWIFGWIVHLKDTPD